MSQALSFTLRISGDDELLGGLRLAQTRMADPFGRGVRNRVRDEFHAEAGEAFKTQGRSLLGRTWHPLSAGYAAWKSARFPGRPILVLTGRMRGALTQPQHPESSFSQPSKTKIQWDVKNRVLPYHLHGTDRMPARPPFQVNQALAQRVAEHIRDGITGVRLAQVRPLFGR